MSAIRCVGRSRPGDRRRTAAALIVTAVGLGVLATPGRAQVIQGRILELGTDRPIAAAGVELKTEPDGDAVVRTSTSETGFFRIDASEPGAYWVKVSALGYVPTTDGPANLLPDDTLDVEFRVRIAALIIDGITVWAEGRSRRLELSGFVEREQSGVGHFRTRDDIEKMGGVLYPTDIFRRIPGVTVLNSFTPGAGDAILVRGSCVPTIYIDGIQMRNVLINDFLNVEDIDGIEVYSGASEIPLVYSGTGSCGVVLIWTG